MASKPINKKKFRTNQLVINGKVQLRVTKSGESQLTSGVVRWKGKISGKGPDIYLGIELNEALGNTDGSIDDWLLPSDVTHAKPYKTKAQVFKCKMGFGIFITESKVVCQYTIYRCI